MFWLTLRLCRLASTSSASSAAKPKRFYKNVDLIRQGGSGGDFYEILLDKRKLRTPNGNLFTVRGHSLASVIAQEWSNQVDVVDRSAMHLTGIRSTVIDNPMNLTSDDLRKKILAFLATDTLLYQCNDPPELVEYQQQHWQPVIDWFEKRFDIDLPITCGFEQPLLSASSEACFDRELRSYQVASSPSIDDSLFAILQCCESLKSLLLTFSLLHRQLSVAEAVFLSRLETNWQIQKWGNVEWHHDVDAADVSSRCSSSLLYFLLIHEAVRKPVANKLYQ